MRCRGWAVNPSDGQQRMATGPSCNFGGIALQVVTTMNGLPGPARTITLVGPLCLIAECVADSGAVDDSAVQIFWLPVIARFLQRAFVRPRGAWIQGW